MYAFNMNYAVYEYVDTCTAVKGYEILHAQYSMCVCELSGAASCLAALQYISQKLCNIIKCMWMTWTKENTVD